MSTDNEVVHPSITMWFANFIRKVVAEVRSEKEQMRDEWLRESEASGV